MLAFTPIFAPGFGLIGILAIFFVVVSVGKAFWDVFIKGYAQLIDELWNERIKRHDLRNRLRRNNSGWRKVS